MVCITFQHCCLSKATAAGCCRQVSNSLQKNTPNFFPPSQLGSEHFNTCAGLLKGHHTLNGRNMSLKIQIPLISIQNTSMENGNGNYASLTTRFIISRHRSKLKVLLACAIPAMNYNYRVSGSSLIPISCEPAQCILSTFSSGR